MINLLPTKVKENITYGRRNRILVRWVWAMVIVICGVVAMTVFGQYFINKNVRSLEAAAAVTQTRIEKQNLAGTQKDIQTLSNNFTTVTQLLSKQVLFSKIFNKIGSIMPSGAYLSGITLTTSSTSMDINVLATSREAATQAFVNISDPKNGLFDKADLISVTCQSNNTNSTASTTPSSPTTQKKYPCTALIKVTMKTDSSFYFLSSIGGSTKQ